MNDNALILRLDIKPQFRPGLFLSLCVCACGACIFAYVCSQKLKHNNNYSSKKRPTDARAFQLQNERQFTENEHIGNAAAYKNHMVSDHTHIAHSKYDNPTPKMDAKFVL